MQDIITTLPILFSFWTSLLIVWSLAAAFCMHKIISKIKQCNLPVRRSDKAVFWMSLGGALILTVFLFGFPSFTALIIDVMVGLDFWYTLFMVYVSVSSLSCWPIISQIHLPRDVNSKPQTTVIYE